MKTLKSTLFGFEISDLGLCWVINFLVDFIWIGRFWQDFFEVGKSVRTFLIQIKGGFSFFDADERPFLRHYYSLMKRQQSRNV